MSIASNGDILSLPIMDIRIGTVTFRRALAKAGFRNLRQAFMANEDEVNRLLSIDNADALYDLKESYEKNPAEFLQRYAVRSDWSKGVLKGDAVAKRRMGLSRNPRPRAQQRIEHSVSYPPHRFILPQDELGKGLFAYEQRAKASLDTLSERGDDYLVFEAFDDFATELNEIRIAMTGLFKRYGISSAKLVGIIEEHLPNLYLLFMSDLARELYDGQMLWGHLFSMLGVSENQEAQYKKLFIKLLERRGMPTYAKGEKDFYYLYTTLLHGGLSNATWEDLWRKTLVPLAKRALADPYRFGQSLDGYTLLDLIQSPESSYAPKKSVLSILEKVPYRTIAPVMGNALQMARDLSDSDDNAVLMVRSYGLPLAATQSLERVRTQDSQKSARRSGAGGSRQREHGIMPIQEGTLLLNLSLGSVTIFWKPQSIPGEYTGYKVEFYVDGILRETREVLKGLINGVLERVEITMRPQSSYSVSIKLLRPVETSKDTKFIEVGTLAQSFERVHAGCFEFLETSDGLFRLRNKKDQLRKTRRIAYILKEERDIRPGTGMTLIEKRFASEDWGGRIIYLYEVQPGASGEVIKKSDGSVLSAWHESFGTTIKREGVMGYTDDGLDLYGVIQGEDCYNAMLPDIQIESADDRATVYDLEISGSCDGKQIEMPAVETLAYEELGQSRTVMVVRLSAIENIPYFARECAISIRQRSTHQLVCRYRFAVIPIARFRLSYVRATDYTATYVFKLLDSVIVTCDKESAPVERGKLYYFQRDLMCEAVDMRFESKDDALSFGFRLGLAGVYIGISDALRCQSQSRPINAADSLGFVFEEELVIRTLGNRSNRSIILRYGDDLLLYGKESRQSEHRFSLFADPSVFSLWGEYEKREFTLELFIGFDMGGFLQRATNTGAAVTLLRLERGLGIGNISLNMTNRSESIVQFEYPSTSDLFVEFFVDFSDKDSYRSGKTKYKTGETSIKAGESSVLVPATVLKDVRFHRHVTMKLYPMDEFGSPDEDFSMELTINER